MSAAEEPEDNEMRARAALLNELQMLALEFSATGDVIRRKVAAQLALLRVDLILRDGPATPPAFTVALEAFRAEVDKARKATRYTSDIPDSAVDDVIRALGAL